MGHDDVAFVAEHAMGDRVTEGDDGLAQAALISTVKICGSNLKVSCARAFSTPITSGVP
ncbi:hypothetical protein B932_3242 [Gluconobacter oxydans H24]|nr:hypothetical protein B932_3242 [Gluconobacter oxydans H24]